MEGSSKDRMMHRVQPNKYSKMLQDILTQTQSLDLSDAQRGELKTIRGKYVSNMSQKESELEKKQETIMTKLHDSDFDSVKLKSEVNLSNQINVKVTD